jgi:hypothetical protein
MDKSDIETLANAPCFTPLQSSSRGGRIVYAYGFEGAKQIATDASNGAGGKAKGGLTPLTFADRFSLLGLGESCSMSIRPNSAAAMSAC